MHSLEFATEMRLGGKFQLRGRGLARVTLRNELLSEAALQIPNPSARRALKVFLENSLEVTL